MRISLFWILPLFAVGCTPAPPWDTQPPQLIGAEVSAGGTELDLKFSEPLSSAKTGGTFHGDQPSEVKGSQVTVPLPQGLKPGKSYEWTAEVRDPGANLTNVRGRFFGPNPHPAELKLNEVRIAGSGPHADLVEVRVEEAGNLGGCTLECWTGPEDRVRFVFPDQEAEPGTLVVVLWKDPPAPEEKELSPEVLRFRVPGAKGLPGTKGLVVLRPTPEALPSDGILYSQIPGAGTELAAAAGWEGTEELDPRGCTATRTWCRTAGPENRWILVTTGSATPGLPNRLIPWAGRPSSPKGASKTKG